MKTHGRNLFVIANRYAQWRRLNRFIYSSLEEAKTDVDLRDFKCDPDREVAERREESSRQSRSWGRAEPKLHHNDRVFEVVDLETHLYNVAFQAHTFKREGTAAPNTTISHIMKLISDGALSSDFELK